MRSFQFEDGAFVLKCLAGAPPGAFRPKALRTTCHERARSLQSYGSERPRTLGSTECKQRDWRCCVIGWFGLSIQVGKALGLLTVLGAVARAFVAFGTW